MSSLFQFYIVALIDVAEHREVVQHFRFQFYIVALIDAYGCFDERQICYFNSI